MRNSSDGVYSDGMTTQPPDPSAISVGDPSWKWWADATGPPHHDPLTIDALRWSEGGNSYRAAQKYQLLLQEVYGRECEFNTVLKAVQYHAGKAMSGGDLPTFLIGAVDASGRHLLWLSTHAPQSTLFYTMQRQSGAPQVVGTF